MDKGDIWRGWYLSKQIGEGGYGKVYYATNPDFSEPCAIKVVSIPKSREDIKIKLSEGATVQTVRNHYKKTVDSLKREIDTMSKLSNCKNIVKIYDADIISNNDGIGWTIVIRMEYLTPLIEHIRKSGKNFDRSEKIKMAIDICTALDECHRKNIIHRDVKPANIFVDNQNNYKLGDFGIARNIEKTSSNLTSTGTPKYIAPEVYKGEEYGKNVDLYSLGLVLYQYFNRSKLPLMSFSNEIRADEELRAVISRIKGVSFGPPCEADDKLAKIISKAVAYDRNNRYKMASEMRRGLEDLLSKKKIEDPTPSPIDEPKHGTNISELGPNGAKKFNTDPWGRRNGSGFYGTNGPKPVPKSSNAGIFMLVGFIAFLIIVSIVAVIVIGRSLSLNSGQSSYYEDPYYYEEPYYNEEPYYYYYMIDPIPMVNTEVCK